MSERNDGGPAYPHESYDTTEDMDTVKPGMTVRQVYKAHAMAGLLANPNVLSAEDYTEVVIGLRDGKFVNAAAEVYAEAALAADMEHDK